MTTRRRVAKTTSERIFTLDVALAKGPRQAGANASVSRTIQMRGDQTLEELHQAITRAYDRPGDFSYEFQFEAGPLHPEGKRYVLPAEYDVSVEAGNPAAGRVTDTPLDALDLRVDNAFSYWPDYGDDWWHPVAVRKVTTAMAAGKYPKITHREGETPYRPDDAHSGQPGRARASFGPEEGADTACLIGELHLSKGEYQRAIEAFSRAIENRPMADAFAGTGQGVPGTGGPGRPGGAGLEISNKTRARRAVARSRKASNFEQCLNTSRSGEPSRTGRTGAARLAAPTPIFE